MRLKGNPHGKSRTSTPEADAADALIRLSERIGMLEAKLAGRIMPKTVTVGFDGDHITITDKRSGRKGVAKIEWIE